MMKKKGVSEMISYVLLIAISIGLAILVFAWLKTSVNVTPVVDCKDGTSVIISDYSCTPGSQGDLKLNLKNNGRFNIDGIILEVGENPEEPPTILLKGKSLESKIMPGYFYFEPILAPGSEKIAEFSNRDEDDKIINTKVVRMQPFILSKNKRIVCQNAIIKQNIDCSKVDVNSIPGLVSWWKFEGDFSDSIGGNTGITNGISGFVSGKKGQAINLNGSQYVSVGSSVSNNKNAGTISMWIKADSLGGLFSRSIGTGWADQRLVMDFYSTGGRLDFILADGVSYWRHFSKSVVPINSWINLIVTWDGVNVKFYFDENLDTTISQGGIPEFTNVKTWIGRTEGVAPDYFKGLIDEVMIYNRALNSSEVAQVYGYFKT